MDQKLKERLVGVAVLLVLGVIFIPLVLDGESMQTESINDIELPVPVNGVTHELDFKDGNVRRVDLPVPAIETEAGAKEILLDSSEANTAQRTSTLSPEKEELEVTGATSETPSQTKVDPVKASSSIIRDNDESKQVAAVVKSEEVPVTLTSATTLKKDITAEQAEIDRVANDPSAAWVVQIGSFGDRNNAENVVAALKAKGFPAFLSRFVSADKKVLYRVRVGPEKDRERAEKLAERLLKAGSKGQVVAHP